MRTNTFLMVVSTHLLASSALAGTMGSVSQPPSWSWVATLSAGPVWGSAVDTQTFNLTPTIEKAYVADQSSRTLFDGEVFLGLQKTISQTMQGQLGLAVAANSNARLSGVIWDDALPEADNFIYDYKIQHTHVALKGKLLVDSGYWLIPWVSGSIGVGFNDAHSFVNTPTIIEALPTPNFASNTETAFTYTIGAGVQKALNDHWQVGVGYEFSDWGKSQLGRAEGQTLNNGLTLNHFYTNGVLFNLTYLA